MQNEKKPSRYEIRQYKVSNKTAFLHSSLRNLVENESKLYLNIKAKPLLNKSLNKNEINPILREVTVEESVDEDDVDDAEDNHHSEEINVDEDQDQNILDDFAPILKWKSLEDHDEQLIRGLIRNYKEVKFVFENPKTIRELDVKKAAEQMTNVKEVVVKSVKVEDGENKESDLNVDELDKQPLLKASTSKEDRAQEQCIEDPETISQISPKFADSKISLPISPTPKRPSWNYQNLKKPSRIICPIGPKFEDYNIRITTGENKVKSKKQIEVSTDLFEVAIYIIEYEECFLKAERVLESPFNKLPKINNCSVFISFPKSVEILNNNKLTITDPNENSIISVNYEHAEKIDKAKDCRTCSTCTKLKYSENILPVKPFYARNRDENSDDYSQQITIVTKNYEVVLCTDEPIIRSVIYKDKNYVLDN